MTKQLSKDEIDKLLAKIRAKFDEYGAEFGERFFNKEAFNQRLIVALKSKIDLPTFAYAEVMALEDKKKQIEDRNYEIKVKTDRTFTKKIEKMFEEMGDRIRKYPELYEDQNFPFEARHLCGALQEFYRRDWLTICNLIDNHNLKDLKLYDAMTQDLQRFASAAKGRLPYEAENFLLNIRRHGEEKALIMFLKEGALVLGRCLTFMSEMTLADPEKVIKIGMGEGIVYNGMMRQEAVSRIEKQLKAMVSDFRFDDLI